MKKKITKKERERKERKRKRIKVNKAIAEWKLAVIERDNWTCQMCKKKLEIRRQCHPHHIISELRVKRSFKDLVSDMNNGILLCYYCHKASPRSAHQGPLEFIEWFKKHKKRQYDYLVKYLNNQKI